MPRFTALLLLCSALSAHAQTSIHDQAKVTELWQPQPAVVQPGTGGAPPADAIVLFDGYHLDAWQHENGAPASWSVSDGIMTVKPGSGDVFTRQHFADVQLHLEWRSPVVVSGSSQGRGNSGVFLMQRYEVQILDSFANETYANGMAASVYKQHIPLVNAARPPGEWQSYDIIFNAPRFSTNGRLLHPATVTVLHNGVLVQNHVTIAGPTQYVGSPNYQAHGPAPLKLQDHGNLVSYRNIWVRAL